MCTAGTPPSIVGPGWVGDFGDFVVFSLLKVVEGLQTDTSGSRWPANTVANVIKSVVKLGGREKELACLLMSCV